MCRVRTSGESAPLDFRPERRKHVIECQDGKRFIQCRRPYQAADRFARASFYVNAIPQSGDPDRMLASVFGVIRNASVPLGISTPGQPEVSSTRWRTVVDHKRLLYFFDSAVSPNVFWVDLKEVDVSAEAGHVKKLDLRPEQSNSFAGDATDALREAEPFAFTGL